MRTGNLLFSQRDPWTGWMDTPGESATRQKFHGVGEEWLEKAEAAQPMGQLVKPDQLAGLVAYLLSPESGVVTGTLGTGIRMGRDLH